MNILFVNYGDFTANSLNHIAGFANTLQARGHACVVAVPSGKETLSAIPGPRFLAATFTEVLARPALFPDGRSADLIHAWTPREVVRKFVLAYQRLVPSPARVIVHLEDNEEFLLESFTGKSLAELRAAGPAELAALLADGLPHPLRHQNFLRVADGITVIVDTLRKFVASYEPVQSLPPGVDFTQYHPQPPDPALRKKLGLDDDEKIIVFTGGTTFANESELRELYVAVHQLNQRGTKTRLLRTGLGAPGFVGSLGFDSKPIVLDLGFVEKALLPRLLALADVLVQPGRPGPFNDYRLPSKLPEFLASGRPVILPATNIAGRMRDGHDALFLKTGAPDEIVGLCLKVFADPALGQRLGAAGTAFARKHFDLAANTTALETFYRATLGRPPLADWALARNGAASELSLLPQVLQNQTAALPAGSVAAELAAQLADLAQQLVHLERAAETYDLPHAEVTGRLAETEKQLAVAEKQIRTLEKAFALTRQHAANLDKVVAETRGHAANLEKVVAETRAQASRTEKRFAISEKLLFSARHQLEILEADVRLTRQHANNLEKLREVLQRRIRELDAQLSDAAQARDNAQMKIRNMQASFSWKATAPLRYLRRKLLDPKPRRSQSAVPTEPGVTPPASPIQSEETTQKAPEVFAKSEEGISIWHSVDHPQSWSLPPRKTTLRGWCFADDGRKFTAVRAVLPDRTVDGTYGFKRLDVLASVRTKPQAEYCGWKIEVDFFQADTRLDLEAADENGLWHHFFHAALRIGEGFGPLDLTSYEKWIEAYDQPTPDSLRRQAEQAATLPQRPLISVLMPVYNTPERWLRRAIESVRAQSYPHWELCIADDASPQAHIRPLLEDYAKVDRRIKVSFREKNGHISAASNSALELVAGDFVALLDHDDEIPPNALYEVAAALVARPETDYLYTDEDKIDEEGRRFEPYFKPDFLPDLFHGQNYTSHLSVYRTALMRKVGGFRVGYEGSQDWDLALRIIEQSHPGRVFHLPKILYHWRAIPGSTALVLSEKNYSVEAARRALNDHFSRLGHAVELLPVPGDHWRVKYAVPAPAPLVSIVIPTRNSFKLVRRCVESILTKTSYPNFEVIIVDNHSDDPATLAWFKEIAECGVRIIPYPHAFNYSAINNFAVQHARGEFIGLLNNDLEVINGDWLDEMVSQAARPGVGCVGALLYYPNDAIQHAGVVVGLGGVAGHAFRDFPRGTAGKFNRARLVQNYSAVTAACLLVRKGIYEEVGGLDEKELAVAFNDIDFCLKVRAAGYRNLWTPFAELYHHESASRGTDDTPEKKERFRGEVETMLLRWGPALTRDPAYNPNLTLELTDFSLAAPPRAWAP